MTTRQNHSPEDWPQDSKDTSLARILAATNRTTTSIYAPSDDSLLMIDALAGVSLEGKKVLDMGTGSGILGLYCAAKGSDVAASDIDPAAIDYTRKAASTLGLQLKLIISDLFAHIHDQYDLILFNPPYLPSNHILDRSTDAGPNGTRFLEAFLNVLPHHLEKRGQALVLVSSLNDSARLQRRFSGLKFSTAANRSFFFEQLQVLRVDLRNDFAV